MICEDIFELRPSLILFGTVGYCGHGDSFAHDTRYPVNILLKTARRSINVVLIMFS